MDKFRYHYYGIKDGQTWHLASEMRPVLNHWFYPKLMQYSDIVYCQGSRGGVMLVYYTVSGVDSKPALKLLKSRYITNDEIAMKEFMWIKLQARDLN